MAPWSCSIDLLPTLALASFGLGALGCKTLAGCNLASILPSLPFYFFLLKAKEKGKTAVFLSLMAVLFLCHPLHDTKNYTGKETFSSCFCGRDTELPDSHTAEPQVQSGSVLSRSG